MALSETMDQSSKELDELNKQRGEIENMWLAEKNKWRLAEKVRISVNENDAPRLHIFRANWS